MANNAVHNDTQLFYGHYTLWNIKKRGSELMSITLSNRNRFSKFFHVVRLCNKSAV